MLGHCTPHRRPFPDIFAQIPEPETEPAGTSSGVHQVAVLVYTGLYLAPPSAPPLPVYPPSPGLSRAIRTKHGAAPLPSHSNTTPHPSGTPNHTPLPWPAPILPPLAGGLQTLALLAAHRAIEDPFLRALVLYSVTLPLAQSIASCGPTRNHRMKLGVLQ
jgi:hypothetical protein